jgi:hypothetical protein
MQAVTVGFRIDGHGPNAQVLAGADHADGNFAAIRN